MPTNAAYNVIIGEERIISIINDGGAGVAVPKLDATGGGLFPLNNPDKGNRKIVLGFQIDVDQEIISEDQNIVVRVKVPDGVIRNHIQRFKADFSAPTPENSNNLLDYAPLAKIFYQSAAAVAAQVHAYVSPFAPNVPDEETQSVPIVIGNNGGASLLAFALEIDFYHSINN